MHTRSMHSGEHVSPVAQTQNTSSECDPVQWLVLLQHLAMHQMLPAAESGFGERILEKRHSAL